MRIPRLAIRNILGAGSRTWLNVIVLSFAYVAIIFNQGFYTGLSNQVKRARIEAELGAGQLWHKNYDPHDPLTLHEAHGILSDSLKPWITQNGVPILIIRGTFYPKGRIRNVLVKGIPPDQQILSIPTHFLKRNNGLIPALIGRRMAKSAGLQIGDICNIQWQDANGTYDAHDVEIVQIIDTSVPTIDHGQIWVPLERLQTLLQMRNQATMIVLNRNVESTPMGAEWILKTIEFLLRDLHAVQKTRTIASWFLYGLLLMLAMLAIFDTQILSIFKRRKEIGTLMALGMPRVKVIQLFTLEGIIHAVLAALLGAMYGIPLLSYFARRGFAVPIGVDKTGYAIGERLFPIYSLYLLGETVIIVLLVTAIISYIPTRKIAGLKPTDALRGKIQT